MTFGTSGFGRTAFAAETPKTLPGDPYWDKVVMLLHGDGANASTSIVDSSSKGYTYTAVGDAKISTAKSKFGGASIVFDGTGDYITTTAPASQFVLPTDFTIEFWANKTANGSVGFDIPICTYSGTSGTTGWWIELSTSRGFMLAGGNGSVIWAQYNPGGTAWLNDGLWHHWAVVRAGSTVTLYKDGVSVATGTCAVSLSAALPIIGKDGSSEYFNGNLDDFRITNGVARYTTAFTPPTAAFPDASSSAPTTATAAGFSSTHLGTPTKANHYAAGFSSAHYGTPKLTLVTHGAGFRSTQFGTPLSEIVTATRAQGFRATHFGTPTMPIHIATGFRATHFGLPFTAHTATGFRSTHFGTPRAVPVMRAASLGRVARFGIPSTPTSRTFAAAGFPATHFGLSVAIRFLPPNLAHTTLARQFRGTRFGQPSGHPKITCQAAGTCSTHLGTPASTLTPRKIATGIQPGGFGVPHAYSAFRAYGFRAGRAGQPLRLVVHHASAAPPRTRFGTPTCAWPDAHIARGVWTTRLGQPRGKSVFPHVVAGFRSGGVGSPASQQVHHALHIPPGNQFGLPLLRRNP